MHGLKVKPVTSTPLTQRPEAAAFPGEMPEQMKPWMHTMLAHGLDGSSGIRRALRSRTPEELKDMVSGIARHARTLPYVLKAFGLPMVPPTDEFWQAHVLPELKKEIERRSRPALPTGGGPIARLKTLDIISVAGRFTELTGSGDNPKGRCPLHNEKSASFYVYADSQRWQCYGACATGGDVVDLLEQLASRGAID
jgi:hypothetical protein